MARSKVGGRDGSPYTYELIKMTYRTGANIYILFDGCRVGTRRRVKPRHFHVLLYGIFAP